MLTCFGYGSRERTPASSLDCRGQCCGVVSGAEDGGMERWRRLGGQVRGARVAKARLREARILPSLTHRRCYRRAAVDITHGTVRLSANLLFLRHPLLFLADVLPGYPPAHPPSLHLSFFLLQCRRLFIRCVSLRKKLKTKLQKFFCLLRSKVTEARLGEVSSSLLRL